MLLDPVLVSPVLLFFNKQIIGLVAGMNRIPVNHDYDYDHFDALKGR